MSLYSYSIPNLAQGISQQPDAQRDPSQGEIQINGMSSILEGLRKRDCSQTIAKVSNTDFGDCYIHSILRDNVEEYLAVVTNSQIRVFDLNGNAQTVNAPSGYSYLSGVTDARAQLRAVTIADYTFITNTNTVPAMNAAVAPAVARPAAHEALVWVKAANYGQTYTVNVNGTQAQVVTAVAPVVTSGTTVTENRISSAEIASRLRGALVGGAATALTVVGSATTLNATVTAVATTTDEGGQGLTVNVTGNGTAVTAVAINAAGNGYRAGDKVFVARSLLQGGTDTTPVQVATISTAAAGPLTGVTIYRSGSVLHLQSSSAITIAANDARANADITAILSQVQAFTELPTIAPQGYQIEITGDPGNNFDGYYVEFKPNSGTFGEGVWSETVSPGVEYQVNATTMPHLLVRLPSGAFYFGPANGSVQGGITIPTWGERVAGDYDTAPDPSFIGNPINDIFIYKNRLGFLSDENVILSRVRQFFEFFPETVTTVLDTDPIDVVASNNRVSVLRYAIPYQDELILFSPQYQFRFNAAETVLTPATAQITVLTQFEVDINVRPQLAGGGIVFCQANGDFSMFREFSVRGAGTALTADAQDLTGYVSAFVPSNVFAMTVNDTSNAVFSISSAAGYEDRIYVYKYFIRNAGSGAERAQSSWSYWHFSGADEILQVLCVRETLFSLVRYGSEIFLEKIPVQDRSPEPPTYAPYPLLLDRRISTTTETPAAMRVAAGTYNASTDLTTWTLPFAATSTIQAWSGYSATGNGGVLLGSITSGTSISARGNWSTQPIYFGEPYNFRYRFTRFKLYKEIGGGKAAANVERTQVRNAKLRYHETAFFQIHVIPEGRDTGIYTFDGTVLGSRVSALGSANPTGFDPDTNRFYEGVFNIPIMSRGERCMVEIHNDTPHPCKFSTCEWVGLITGKARSLR